MLSPADEALNRSCVYLDIDGTECHQLIWRQEEFSSSVVAIDANR